MSYRQIKWLILIIPSLVLTTWEYTRHHFFLDHISMELGNWLSPLIEFTVSLTFLMKLFAMLEATQEELQRERSRQIALKEREKIARELHDDIAQSLFLMSIKMDQLEHVQEDAKQVKQIKELRKTVHQVNEYVRQAISNLRYPTDPDALPWMQYLESMVHDFTTETGIEASWNWHLSEEQLSAKEKVELYASIREALLNVRKHARAKKIWIQAEGYNKNSWSCIVKDDGVGFENDKFGHKDRYGLKIMHERAEEMGWMFQINSEYGKTSVEIRKEAS
ncbi:histidine kinase [Paenibacillus alginolyticus]|uniref:sensor histidine kinase n=1 Tax=Paenibacillus alginolyticus TaxID=59839 RepID=UPI00041E3982|nr:histidine kinase [Paenibacillus alginolyticus]MCY9670611.1 histidine kinase [Paenibacillus alginolyticus]